MKILFLCDFFSSLGGAEYYNFTLISELKKRGHDVRVVIGEKPKITHWIKLLNENGVPFIASDEYHKNLKNNEIENKLITHHITELDSWHPDVIHVHPFGKLICEWLSHTKIRVPIVATEWTTPNHNTQSWFVSDKLVDKHVSAYIATCRAVERGIKNYHSYTGKIVSIPHLIADIPKESTILQRDVSSKSIGYIGRFSAEKGLDFLLGAWKSISEDNDGVSLHIYGHGEDEAHLKKLCEALGVEDSVFFEGTFPPMRGISEVAHKHTFFVQPSLFESIPTSLIELMLHGKAVIATDVGGISELITDKKTGLLVSPGSTEEIVNAVNLLLSDSELLEHIGSKARKKSVKIYDLKKNIDAIENLYQSLTE